MSLYTTQEYDQLVLAAIQGMEIETDPEDPGDVPLEVMEWVSFCEWVKSANMLIHLVLSGVLVPSRRDGILPEGAGYVYVKTDVADALMEDFGKGDHPLASA